jgi:GntR family transcriptional regulator
MTDPASAPPQRALPLPRHHRAYLLLRQRLHALAPDELLPGENLLAAEFGVARMTLRRALRRLEEEGRIVRRRGEGTRLRVLGTADDAATGMDTVSQLLRIGAATANTILGIADEPAGTDVADGLAVPPGTNVRRAEIVRSLGSVRVSHLAAYFPNSPAIRRLSARMLATKPLLSVTERLCGPVDQVEQRVTAVLADGALTEALAVDPGEPLMRVVRWFRGAGAVRQFSIAHYRADCFAIRTVEDVGPEPRSGTRQWHIEMRLADRDW